MPTIREINLIKPSRPISPQVVKLQKTLLLVTQLILIVYVVILSGIFTYSIVLVKQLEQTDIDIEAQREKIKSLSQNEGIYMLLKQKAAVINQITLDRYPFNILINYFADLKYPNSNLANIKFDDVGNVVLSFTIENSDIVDQLVKKLLDDANTRFKNIKITSAAFTKDGKYNISLDITAFVKQPNL